eukprot:CAMPEP_0178936418 /NCGR_PEP_ID=MMETSP0786-20121207/25169_1 /TAXON_ID=186022 /ORGANISM="Thalassionema frauenfeldii, Strain CCMP 1798" /LENGTH=121 /DNA_ID=CAMNT_0020614833 /DNA_START=11 /DNA_END=376 /DNA_ORIENTATION=-
MKQLQHFMGIDLAKRSNNFANLNCANKIYDKATDLDPQPLFPLRNKPEYTSGIDPAPDIAAAYDPLYTVTDSDYNQPPYVILFILWTFGLVLWRMVFMSTDEAIKIVRERKVRKDFSTKYV